MPPAVPTSCLRMVILDGAAVCRRILAAVEELRRGRREDEVATKPAACALVTEAQQLEILNDWALIFAPSLLSLSCRLAL